MFELPGLTKPFGQNARKVLNSWGGAGEKLNVLSCTQSTKTFSWSLVSLALLTALTTGNAHAESKGTLGGVSDALTIGVPATAFVLSLYNEEPVDAGEFLLTLAAQELFVEGAKSAMSHTKLGERPSDKDKDSSNGFISSHVSATTAGAIKIWEMYPENYYVRGASALAVCVVGYQRIDGDHHTPLQVGLGVGTAFLFDWLGELVSDWLRDDSPAKVYLGESESSKLSFSMIMPSEGLGSIGVLTYIF